MSINLSDLTAALCKVEQIHKITLENVHQYLHKNEVFSIEIFHKILSNDSIDERFKTIDQAFSALGDVNTYLLEASYLIG
ncbi:hypothetical protein ONE56_08290 [Vibrio mytili]|uniref:hypothetical protein n=1 Tax=Vibrio mytili TaxID=50718 RepID=UPI003C6FC65F